MDWAQHWAILAPAVAHVNRRLTCVLTRLQCENSLVLRDRQHSFVIGISIKWERIVLEGDRDQLALDAQEKAVSEAVEGRGCCIPLLISKLRNFGDLVPPSGRALAFYCTVAYGSLHAPWINAAERNATKHNTT